MQVLVPFLSAIGRSRSSVFGFSCSFVGSVGVTFSVGLEVVSRI